jgi:hypothetical protein
MPRSCFLTFFFFFFWLALLSSSGFMCSLKRRLISEFPFAAAICSNETGGVNGVLKIVAAVGEKTLTFVMFVVRQG